ncbi:aldehyde dehydrogenase family protein [Psychromarinibacter sp. S121]|uniref:aldehyde dehydrogenase family protein n=1 Tax=Psychromarinibacter sp. S121 TaxID=3415127 RepID=UPI003C7C7753
MTVQFSTRPEGPHLRGIAIDAKPSGDGVVAQHLIGGIWEDGGSGRFLRIDSPATGERLGHVPMGTASDIDRAVAAAEDARDGLVAMGTFARAALCMDMAAAIDAAADELAPLLSLEQGKPLAEARAEVGGAALGFRNAAEQIKWLETGVIPVADPAKRAHSFLQPKGVFGIITPWNFPLGLPCMYYLGPALATGNAVVWVPAPSTSLVAYRLAQLLVGAGMPEGALNLVTGDGAEVGDATVVHPGVHAIGFTGSTATGMTIARRGAGKPLLLELGGNGPTVVLEDADVELAAARVAAGAFGNAGQICTATERVLVHQSLHDRFVELLARAAGEVRLGHPLEPGTTMGPLNNAASFDKMLSHMDDARARGAQVLAGGGTAQGLPTNLYFQPTIVTGLDADSLLNREESFGPVVPVLTFADEAEALRLAATSPYGLSAAVFTRSITAAYRLTEKLRAGIVNINEMSSYWEPHVPAGGASGTQSGLGRTGGRHTLMEMCDLKTMVVDIAV